MRLRLDIDERLRRMRPAKPARLLAMVALGATAVIAGCSQPPTFQFDELDGSRAQAFSEFSLGTYQIPVPVVQDRADDNARLRNRLRFDFELHALVAPGETARMSENWERHQGKIRDHVMRICRNATIDDLQEPELATLKARLMDALRTELGDRQVRRLLLTEVDSQEL